MKKNALVTAIEGEDIFVVPLIKSECAGCAAGCDKRGAAFAVSNSRGLDIKVGDTVKLASASLKENVRGLISLLFPVASAVAGYFLAAPIASLWGKTAGEGTRALCVLGFLFVAAGIVLLSTRSIKLSGKSEIISKMS